MSYPPDRMMPPVESRKRKERELFHYNKTTAEVTTKPKPSTPLASTAAMKGAEPAVNNQILAGYMAYEFLTKGTLLGKMYNTARAESGRAGAFEAELELSMPKDHVHEQYGEVTSILKTEGTHIPGIVNPTQLARWIQM